MAETIPFITLAPSHHLTGLRSLLY